MPPPTTAPASLADALRTYFVAFLPLDAVDEALGELSRRAAGARDRTEVFRIASAVLHDRARLTREVEALVLALEVRLGVQGAADVLQIPAADVEAVLLDVATAETSELPTMSPVDAAPAPAANGQAPHAATLPEDSPSPAAASSPDPAPAVGAGSSSVLDPDGPEPVGPSGLVVADAPELAAPSVLDTGPAPEASAPPAAATSEPEAAPEETAVAEPQDSALAEIQDAEFERLDDVRERRRGRLVVAFGLGLAVVLAGGLLLMGRANGFAVPAVEESGLARVEGVVTLRSAVLGSAADVDPPAESATELPAGAGAALHLRYSEERAERDDALGVVWYRGETELYRTSWRLAQPLGEWRAELPPPASTAPGEYRAEVVVNGSIVHSVPFVVTAAAADASDAPAAPAGR